MYTIIDIETTGNGIKGNRITEISIFKYDGHEVIDEFTSLVNPECPIPAFITGLTGIDDDMVRNAPLLEELIPQIVEITKDTIFVAHSVNFDYNVIKNEFKLLGHDFSRKKLCTVRLSRKLLPGYNSYSLGKLTAALGIPLTDRHRARGDAHATVLLFHKLLRAENADTVFKQFLNSKSQEATLPPGLPKEEYLKLPTTAGVYYFKDSKGKIIYVGKAKNIKKRVLGHFYDKKTKEITLCAETTSLDFEETGNELIALLKESAEIKHHYPKYNSAQKRSIQQYGIFTYEDRNGIIHLAFNKIKMTPNPVAICYSPTEARQYLETLCSTFELCPKYCHLQENVAVCSHYKIKQCIGICSDLDIVEEYNQRVQDALQSIKEVEATLVIKTNGRTMDENGFVVIRENNYSGYGFAPTDVAIKQIEDLEMFITPQKNTLETQRIVESYVRNNPTAVFAL
ncbi:exonuclease domain-containing protein [Maribacter sp. 1_MG-2023]|uniref:exonuclease domain-containing protein n=1 Tax=Maribacter sp. 1_MG-2023 TaxID=3062677 RepID=UPI0026E3C492|nr:exonuclease domain-containing protein [Maribacter sp. 1_MG-2023]MDO6470223.1 exonuclease domain-containing protein [Maribacter sp. 1_MG-2023]